MPVATDRGEGVSAERPQGRYRLAAAVTLVAVLAVSGAAGSIYGGWRLAESSWSDWFERSRREAVELSASVDGALLQIEVQLKALATLFYGSERVDPGELAEAEQKLLSDGLSVTLSGLAFAVAVEGEDRRIFEAREGVQLSYPGLPELLAPRSFTHFPVALSSRRYPLFSRGVDLAAHPDLRAMALSAVRLGRTVVMSPAFRLDQDWLIGFAIAVPNGSVNGVLFGIMPLDHLLEHTVRWKPDGLVLHLFQYPSSWEDGDGATLIHGPLEAAGNLAATYTHRFTHGEARWALRWDVLPSYNGGVTVLPAWLLAAAGSLLSLLVGLAVSLLLYQNALIRRRVDLRTAELKMALDRAEEASRAKTNFLAVIGHELRTPLNAVIGFADLLEPAQSTPTSRNYIRFVQGGGRHLLRLVNALLEVAQAEQGELVLDDEEVDLRTLIHKAVSLAGSSVGESTAVIDIGLPEALPSIRGDGPRLELVILNLVLNAVRAAGDGGKVTVEALVREDHGIRVTVRDTGPGMAAAQVTASLRLFEQVEGPLNRRHEGLGIGLPLCRHLVRLHGGSLSIDTRPGGGTTVTVDLPPERTLSVTESDVRLRAP